MTFMLRGQNDSDQDLAAKLAQRIAADHFPHLKADGMRLLHSAVTHACAYARSMIDMLESPFVLQRNNPEHHTLGAIFFDSRTDALAALRSTARIKSVFSDPVATECFFVMTMRRHEYTVFGTELAGEMIRRDVMQDAVEFLDHKFSVAAPSMDALRRMMTENVVLYLAGLSVQRRGQDKRSLTDLRQSEEVLRAQMKTLQCAINAESAYGRATLVHHKMEQAQRDMTELKARLTTLAAQTASDNCLQELDAILSAPHEHIRLEQVELCVGDFGIMSKTGKTIRFHECCFADQQRLGVFLCVIDRENARHLWPDLD